VTASHLVAEELGVHLWAASKATAATKQQKETVRKAEDGEWEDAGNH
jgi:hypothetical protein